jgi:hypothetical protein
MNSYCEVCEKEGTEFCDSECDDCGLTSHCNHNGLCSECQEKADEEREPGDPPAWEGGFARNH